MNKIQNSQMDANGTYLIWCRTIHLNIFNGKPRTFLLGIAWKLGHFGILQTNDYPKLEVGKWSSSGNTYEYIVPILKIHQNLVILGTILPDPR